MSVSAILHHNIGDLVKEAKKWPKRLNDVERRAVNDTLVDVQKFTTSKLLPKKFTLRSKWWKPGTKFGFNIRFAKKGRPDPEGIVGSQADWLKEQEFGGTRRPRGTNLAVPTLRLKDRSAKITRARKPRTVAGKPRAFIVREGHPSLPPGIWRRKTRSRLPIEMLFKFERSLSLKPILGFEDDGGQLADKLFEQHFRTRFEQEFLSLSNVAT